MNFFDVLLSLQSLYWECRITELTDASKNLVKDLLNPFLTAINRKKFSILSNYPEDFIN